MRNVNSVEYFAAFLICLSFFTVQPSFTQVKDQDPVRAMGIRYHQSTVIQHSQKLSDEITNINPWIIETELAWHLRDKKTWSYCHCFPRTGFGLRHINFDNPDVLGSSVVLYGFIEPFINAGNKLNFSSRFGIGPAYLTKVFDDEENPENLFFGSPLSFIVLLNLGINYRL
ncbi:MAG: hypothetical protein ACOCWA_06275, partial [Bacteroidota bacterium]